MSHRIVVMCEGRITGELSSAEATQERDHAPRDAARDLGGRRMKPA